MRNFDLSSFLTHSHGVCFFTTFVSPLIWCFPPVWLQTITADCWFVWSACVSPAATCTVLLQLCFHPQLIQAGALLDSCVPSAHHTSETYFADGCDWLKNTVCPVKLPAGNIADFSAEWWYLEDYSGLGLNVTCCQRFIPPTCEWRTDISQHWHSFVSLHWDVFSKLKVCGSLGLVVKFTSRRPSHTHGQGIILSSTGKGVSDELGFVLESKTSVCQIMNVTVSMCVLKVSSDFIAASALFSLAFAHMGERPADRLCAHFPLRCDVHTFHRNKQQPFETNCLWPCSLSGDRRSHRVRGQRRSWADNCQSNRGHTSLHSGGGRWGRQRCRGEVERVMFCDLVHSQINEQNQRKSPVLTCRSPAGPSPPRQTWQLRRPVTSWQNAKPRPQQVWTAIWSPGAPPVTRLASFQPLSHRADDNHRLLWGTCSEASRWLFVFLQPLEQISAPYITDHMTILGHLLWTHSQTQKTRCFANSNFSDSL